MRFQQVAYKIRLIGLCAASALSPLVISDRVLDAAERETPHFVPCAALATASEDELEFQRRLVGALGTGPALRRSTSLVARVVARPSSGPEWAISVYMGDVGDAQLEVAIAQESIYEANRVLKKNEVVLRSKPALVEVSHSSAILPRDVGTQLAEALSEILAEIAKPEKSNMRAYDGTAYTASQWVRGRGVVCGQIHEPSAGSPPSSVVSLGELLREYAQAPLDRQRVLLGEIQEGARQASSGRTQQGQP